ncbi:MAG: LytTR family DNA-binding domain-containing protein [Bacteroidales bacterium]|nr:LytTR family DNA-binding domain-containing protein [Bacteroidales bacterium]
MKDFCVSLEILYIEGLDDYIYIRFSVDKKQVMTLMSLKSVMEKLPESRFMRVHRSFIISMKNVSSIRNKYIFLGKVKIPVGDTCAEAVNSWLPGK